MRAIPLLALAVLLGGCTTHQAHLAVATTRQTNLDLRRVDLAGVPVERYVEGTDTAVTSILILPTFDAPRLEDAVEDALERGGGDVMAYVQVETTSFWLGIGVSRIRVRGNVVELGEYTGWIEEPEE